MQKSLLVVELLAMDKHGQKSTWTFARVRTSRLRSRACAAALAATLCCTAIPVGALADENPPETPGLSEETQPPEPPEEDLPPEPSEEAQSPEPSEESNPDASADTEASSSTPENPSDSINENVVPDADTSSSENLVSDETLDTTPSNPTTSEEANPSADANADDGPIETIWVESPDSDYTESATEEEDDRDGTIEGEQKTPEEEALDKLAQANAIYDHMSRLAGEIDALQARYDELKAASDEASSHHKKTREALKLERKKLNMLKEEMSSHVVEMYKQGGTTPYLDVLCGAASYEEFLSLWHMLGKVAHYGESEFREQEEIVKALEAKMGDADDRIEAAEKEAEDTRVKLNRSWLTYLSLAPHAASLRMEAAAMLGDNAGLASAQAEYDSASAELRNALDQGLAEAGRLEGEGIFTNPCPDAAYSSGFGYRTFDNAYHLGLDMAIGEGTPYYAADDGVVIDATNGGGYNGGAGNWIVIDHGNGVVTKYMHSAVTFVSPGETVVRGQNIGLVGNTGNSSGPHLHFQVEIDGVAVDPLVYL